MSRLIIEVSIESELSREKLLENFSEAMSELYTSGGYVDWDVDEDRSQDDDDEVDL